MFIEKESLRSYEKFLKICGPLAKIMVVFFKNVNKNKNFFASPWKKIRRQEKIVAIEFFHRQSKISSPALFCVAFLLTCRRRQRCTPLGILFRDSCLSPSSCFKWIAKVEIDMMQCTLKPSIFINHLQVCTQKP